MSDQPGSFEGEPELLAGPLIPILHHSGLGLCVEGTVDLHTVQTLRVVDEKFLALHVFWIEFSLPAGITEAGDPYVDILSHTSHSLISSPVYGKAFFNGVDPSEGMVTAISIGTEASEKIDSVGNFYQANNASK